MPHPARALALALLLLLPTARPEPDTPDDRASPLTWPAPPREPGRVHLDVVRVEHAGVARLFAWFGEWTDCDGDGRVGHAGLPEYPAAVLDAASPCAGAPHVAGGTVRELLWLDPSGVDGEASRGDASARVFADLARPRAPAGSAPKTSPDVLLAYRAGPLPLDPGTPAGAALCAALPCGGWWSAPLLPELDASPYRARHVTAYGIVGPAYLSKWGAAVPGSASYGADACAARAPGWVCDKARWTGPIPLGATVRLRDVDDASLAPPPGTERDDARDGIGDAWNESWRVLDALSDLDADGAPARVEFEWGTLPLAVPPDAARARDHDLDGWLDGAEIAYWDAHPDDARRASLAQAGLAGADPDAAGDVDGDGVPNQRDADADGDGLLDGAEVENGTFPELRDSDCAAAAPACPGPTRHADAPASGGDGFPDAEEVAYWRGRDPDCDRDGVPNVRDADSDADGLLDGQEVPGLDPCDPDADDDGLRDGEEAATDPRDADTDDDGMPDGWETRHALAPTDAADADDDPDADGVTNADEHALGAHPRLPDSDLDGLGDGAERGLGTDAARWDTDRDGMPDGWEAAEGLDPLRNDAEEDPDQDGTDAYAHANLDEYLYGRPVEWDEAATGPWTGGTRPLATDSDGDGAADGEEVAHGTDPTGRRPTERDTTHRDPDGDGLATAEELALGSKPLRPDTDGDGLCDGAAATACVLRCAAGERPVGERDAGANLLLADSDDDGLADGEEACLGTTPRHPDTDGDGVPDAGEVRAGTSPTAADSDHDGLTDGEEAAWEHDGRRTDALDADTDGDGASDGEEVLRRGTHPLLPDADHDGLLDGEEVRTSPLDSDSDDDGMPDGWEARHGLDATRDDAAEDKDRDARALGLTNLQEHRLGTRPDVADTDGDGLDDWTEVLLGLDPLADDAAWDADGDGLANLHEHAAGTRPSLPDTDGDGLGDAWEAGDPALAALGLPRTRGDAADTDGDGLDDGRERALWGDAWATDFDGDGGLVDALAHNLRDTDSDNDGLDDGHEFLALRTRADRADTDGDGASDRDEVMTHATDPRDAASRPGAPRPPLDADGDGLGDDAERAYGTDPRDADTDGDDAPDGVERVAWGVDWAAAFDADGTPSNLVDPDADDDGVPDGVELASAGLPRRGYYATSARHADTDGDGLPDGEEDDNGLVGRGAARARGGPPLLPERLPDVLGAFGIPLYATSSGDGAAGRAQPRRSSPDATDSDGDLLGDGAEAARGTLWSDPDTDRDGVTDFLEPHADPDADGLPNGLDPDSDNDGLPDEAEDANRNGRPDRGESSLHDADTDEDALCDGDETRSDAQRADTDADGLPDGHEERRAGACLTPSPRGPVDWTRRDATLPTGGPAYAPWLGPDAAPAPNAAGLFPVQTLDFDEDGLLDGLEDADADGLRAPGETDPALADSDEDGLADGLEVRVWGRMTLATFLRRAADRGLDPAQARAYTPGAWLETDPNDADTDDDGIRDGWDINPNGLNPARLQLVFDELRMFDPVDPWGDWAPEPYFDITLETAAGTTTLHTPNLPSLPMTKREPVAELSSLMTADLHRTMNVERVGSLIDFDISEGLLRFSLPEDIKSYRESGIGSAGLTQARVSLRIGDADTGAGNLWGGRDLSDIIDIGKHTDDNTYAVSFVLGSSLVGGGRPLAEQELVEPADGSEDSASWTNHMSNAHDDGRLSMRLFDEVRSELLAQAKTVKSSPNHFAAPPAGQSWGS